MTFFEKVCKKSANRRKREAKNFFHPAKSNILHVINPASFQDEYYSGGCCWNGEGAEAKAQKELALQSETPWEPSKTFLAKWVTHSSRTILDSTGGVNHLKNDMRKDALQPLICIQSST